MNSVLAEVQMELASLGTPMTRRATSPRDSDDESEFLDAFEREARSSRMHTQMKEGGDIAPKRLQVKGTQPRTDSRRTQAAQPNQHSLILSANFILFFQFYLRAPNLWPGPAAPAPPTLWLGKLSRTGEGWLETDL